MENVFIAIVLAWFLIVPFVGGWYFFIVGLQAMVDYDEEFDVPKKKHGAILDIILGTALLLFYNAFFWLLWPLFVLMSGLNLPTFSLPI
jgi:hypothetical protein